MNDPDPQDELLTDDELSDVGGGGLLVPPIPTPTQPPAPGLPIWANEADNG